MQNILVMASIRHLHNIIGRIVAMAVFCIATLTAGAQEARPWEELLMQWADDEDYESDVMDDYYELLCELENSPININAATEDDLMRLPFLTDQQRMDISEYLYRYGGMATLGELSMIASLDMLRQRLMRCFVYVGEKATDDSLSLKTLLQRGRHELTASAGIPLYDRRGDKNGYLGYKYKHWLRYDFSSCDRLRIGFVAAQDGGEPFFTAGNGMGYDHYSFFVQMKKMGMVENIVVGRYKVSAAKGLVVNTGISFGKSSLIAGLHRSQMAVRPHSSRSADKYMQGAAATLKVGKRMKVMAYASYRAIDATLNDDGTAATIVGSGYHRTPTEMQKKNNTKIADAGMSVSYDKGPLHLGVTAAYTHLDRRLQPQTKSVYRRFYPQGNSFMNASVDYGYRLGRMMLSGETAIDKSGGVATLNMLNGYPLDNVTLTAVHRYYSRGYQSLRASSYSDGGRVQNEHGIYIGVAWQPRGGLTLSAYSDYAYFEWPKYLVSQSSASWDNVLAASYSKGKWRLAARYRMRLRQRDNEKKTALTDKIEHRANVTATCDWNKVWTTTTRADGSLTSYNGNSRGYMVSQTVNYHGRWLTAGAAVRYFKTDDYNSRLYAYEGGLYYTFGSRLCYGHGIGYSVHLKAQVARQLSLTARLSTSNRFDANSIGSGMQMVEKSSLTDIDVQLRWKF